MNRSLQREDVIDRLGNACTIFTSIDGDDTLIRIRDCQYRNQLLPSYDKTNCNSESVIDGIRKKLKDIRETFAAVSSNVTLYPRHWKPSNSNKNTNHSNEFTVATFNILAHGLSSGPTSKFPAPSVTEEGFEGNYGGFTHLIRPDIALNYEWRKWRLLSVLLGDGIVHEEQKMFDDTISVNVGDRTCDLGVPFDVVAMQEVDDYHAFWHPLLVSETSRDNDLKQYQGVF